MKIEFLTDRGFEGSVSVEAGPFKNGSRSIIQKWKSYRHRTQQSLIFDYSYIMPLVNLANDMTLQNYLTLVIQYLEIYTNSRLEGDTDEVQISAFYQDGNITKEFNFKGSTDALKSSMKKFDLNKFMEAP